MRLHKGLAFMGLGLAGLYLACAQEPVAGDGQVLPAGYGRLAAELQQGPKGGQVGGGGPGKKWDVEEIIVTIPKVTAHAAGSGWVTLMDGPARTLDLLKLPQETVNLGFANLPPGKITQIRLYVKPAAQNHVVLPGGEQIPLKVPSGPQSGIKLKGGFEVNACQTTTVTLAFDGKKSIHVHPTGQGDLWILRPVIHTRGTTTEATPCAPADAGTPGDGDGDGNGGGTGNGPGDGGTPGGVNETPGGTGASCDEGQDCLSGSCQASACAPGGAGAPCAQNGDCASGTCTEATCTAPPSAVGTGGACTADALCLSNSCTNGACDPGGQGSPCNAASDCAEGFNCGNGACWPAIQ